MSTDTPGNTIWQKIADEAKLLLPKVKTALDTIDPALAFTPTLKLVDEALSALIGLVEASIDSPTDKAAALARLSAAVRDALPLLDADIATINAANLAAQQTTADGNPPDPV
jgi:hypothetical protein